MSLKQSGNVKVSKGANGKNVVKVAVRKVGKFKPDF